MKAEKINPNSPEEKTSGRSIADRQETEGSFRRLREYEDYKTLAVNNRVVSVRDMKSFLVFSDEQAGEEKHLISPPHWRTLSFHENIASFVKSNGKKEPFFTVNTKGVGYLKPITRGEKLEDYETWHQEDNIEGERVLGIAKAQKFTDPIGDIIEKSNFLVDAGLRTEVAWGVVELKRIPYAGEMKTLSELDEIGVLRKKLDTINKKIKPIQIVRLLKNNTRIGEALEADDRRKAIFEEAFATRNMENSFYDLQKKDLHIGNPEEEKEYSREIAKHIAHNLTVLFNTGYTHGALHTSNISMAGEFVDLEPAQHWTKDTKISGWKDLYRGVRLHHIKDLRDATYSLRNLIRSGKKAELATPNRQEIMDICMKALKDSLNKEKLAEQKNNYKNILWWAEQIFDTVLIKKERLPSLMHHHISEWPINYE